jgi:hypothetical protein
MSSVTVTAKTITPTVARITLPSLRISRLWGNAC